MQKCKIETWLCNHAHIQNTSQQNVGPQAHWNLMFVRGVCILTEWYLVSKMLAASEVSTTAWWSCHHTHQSARWSAS